MKNRVMWDVATFWTVALVGVGAFWIAVIRAVT